ncbi:apoptosis-associated speck-like protein containing a CARD [Bufo gargarizans]|uniref:apoptosis-associated speck-like protein containing a CARD n=1 Tax=Bufo gargarizans TaxID=30331 RepID=UPI001CF2ACAA|nr:apoptosis-associated speck-like protein containing a CARD [Bufo gargarizans]
MYICQDVPGCPCRVQETRRLREVSGSHGEDDDGEDPHRRRCHLEVLDVTDGEHFVDRHRAELIRRVKQVDPILDDLYQHKLLTTEAYDTVRSKATSQRQMRELFRHVESWWNKDKDQFLKSLRKNNQPLIRNLE